MTSDDWTSITGEFWFPEGRKLVEDDGRDPEPTEITERDLNLLDSYFHELGVLAGEVRRPPTVEEQAEDDALLARMRERMSKSPAEVRAERARRRRIGGR